MKIPEQKVEEVVKEASMKMSDPNYSAVMVGTFVQEQSAAAQYISTMADELGGTENVVTAIFHASLIGQCFQRVHNRSVPTMTFDDLNHASEGDREALLEEEKQPAIGGYIASNVEDKAMQRVLMLMALAMDWVQ